MEDRNLEYSEGIPEPHRLITKIIGMLNGSGGKFLIGINDDTKKPAGKKFFQQDEHRLIQVLTDNILPRPTINIQIKSDLLGDVIEIHVWEELDCPYYKKSEAIPEGVYVRIGSSTQKATKEDVARLFRKRSNSGYDEKIITLFSGFKSASLNILNQSKLEEYIKNIFALKGVPLQNITNEHIISIKAASEFEGAIYPTIGGILMFCDDPHGQVAELSSCYIRGAMFKGDTARGDIIDQKEFKGSLDSQIQAAFVFVKSHLNLGAVIKGIKRKDALEIPDSVIRELIINAVTHREYSIGATINIAIFNDRVEFYSPGALPTGVTPENIVDQSVIRNKIIAEYLFRMNYIEKFGLGWDKIMLAIQEYGIMEPKIDDSGSSVKVTIRRARTTPLQTRIVKNNILSMSERKILSNLEKGKVYRIKDIMDIVGSSSEVGVKKILGGLRSKGYLNVFDDNVELKRKI